MAAKNFRTEDRRVRDSQVTGPSASKTGPDGIQPQAAPPAKRDKNGNQPPATGKYPGKCCSSERIFLLLLSGACPPAPRYRLAARLPHHTDLAVFHLATPYKDKAYAYCEEYYLLVCHSERHLPARRRKCRLPGRYQGRRQNHLQPLSRKSDRPSRNSDPTAPSRPPRSAVMPASRVSSCGSRSSP